MKDYARICCLRKADHPLSLVSDLHYKHFPLYYKSRTGILSQAAEFQPLWKYKITSLIYIYFFLV